MNEKLIVVMYDLITICGLFILILISISDNGPGLSEEDQKRVFERFFRADPSRVRVGGEGSGLGLAIVDAVMKAHGGRVEVNSKIGAGATFTIVFPQKDL